MATQVSQLAADVAPVTAAPPHRSTTARLTSLDAFRGFIMFWLAGGTAIIHAIAGLGKNPVSDWLRYEFDHSAWVGLHFYDLIWPAFMLMVGVSVPFSFAKRSLTSTRRQWILHALKRASILFLLGSLRTSLNHGSPQWIELSSALQPIAVAYFVAALLVDKSPRLQAAVGALIVVGYALLLALVGAPGIPAGSYQINANLVTAVDLAVLGRSHPEGWGTVLSTIPTISTTILGLLLGGLLRSNRTHRTKMEIIGFAGVSGVALGWALHPVIPVIMKLWTTSYGIASAGWACLLFLPFYWIADVRGYRTWAFPFVVIGVNAVAAYMGMTLIPISRHVSVVTKGLVAHMGAWGPLLDAVCVLRA
jgi:predicted acyltransferase